MTDIVFHIGLHKTATTTLQQQFFPKCSELNFLIGHSPETRDFLRYVSRTDNAYFAPDVARRTLARHLLDGTTNLISSESFSWLSWSAAHTLGLDFRTQILRNLSAAYPKARVILVLRRQDTLARSLYRQYLQAGGTKNIIKVLGKKNSSELSIIPRNYFFFRIYVKELLNSFPSGVQMLLFEEFICNQELFLKKLADFIGCEKPIVELTRTNSSQLGNAAMEMTRLLNHVFRTPLNPAGLLPGFPVRRGGRIRRITPSYLLHDHWPGSRPVKASSALHLRCREILDEVNDDNAQLDRELDLGLKDYGYYK